MTNDKNFLQIDSTNEANKTKMEIYRFERFSRTKDAYLFVKRRYETKIIDDQRLNFIEAKTVAQANAVNMNLYRFEIFSDVRGSWIFIKRRSNKKC